MTIKLWKQNLAGRDLTRITANVFYTTEWKHLQIAILLYRNYIITVVIFATNCNGKAATKDKTGGRAEGSKAREKKASFAVSVTEEGQWAEEWRDAEVATGRRKVARRRRSQQEIYGRSVKGHEVSGRSRSRGQEETEAGNWLRLSLKGIARRSCSFALIYGTKSHIHSQSSVKEWTLRRTTPLTKSLDTPSHAIFVFILTTLQTADNYWRNPKY